MFGSSRTGRAGRPDSRQVAVLGLGRFGSSLALELIEQGIEVLGVDVSEPLVQKYADSLTRTAVADTTDPEVLSQLGIADFDRVVVGIGSDLEASILTCAVLVDFQIPNIWAKAITRQHGRILDRVGATHVILPEQDMGQRVAHLVIGRMLDYIKFDDNFAMVKTIAPEHVLDKSLADSHIRSRWGITVVGLKQVGQQFTYATQDTVPRRGDVMIVSGTVKAVESFANES